MRAGISFVLLSAVAFLLFSINTCDHQEAPDHHEHISYFKDFDAFHLRGILHIETGSAAPYIAIADSGRFTFIDVVADSLRHWREVYRRGGDYISCSRRPDSTQYEYEYIYHDTIITYTYEGDTIADDEHHYIISVSVATPQRKVLFHFYPFIYSIRPAARCITDSLPHDRLGYMAVSDYDYDGDILRETKTENNYAERSTGTDYILYDLRKYPRYFMKYLHREMRVR